MSFDKFNKGKKVLAALTAAAALTFCACNEKSDVKVKTAAGTETQAQTGGVEAPAAAEVKASEVLEELVKNGEVFTERDMSGSWEESSAVKVKLTGDSAETEDSSVKISGSTVTFTQEGVYLISGTLSNGQLVVEADKSAKVQLVLDGCDITCENSAAVWVKQGDKVFVTLRENSENSLASAGEFSDDESGIDGAVFSKEDLTINGSGTLKVTCGTGHGIVSKDDLAVTGGKLDITSAKHGLSGKDSVRIGGAEITVNAGGDGVHSENADDASLGFIYVNGGKLDITSQGDGMDSASTLMAEGGDIEIVSGGGSSSAQPHQEQFKGGMYRQNETYTETDEQAGSKGLKGSGALIVTGGKITADCCDDSLHSNGSVSISGGEITVSSGDDGIHADSAAEISGGKVTVSQSYEGIEGQTILISGGTVEVNAGDDGLNAAGGNDGSGFEGRGGDMFTADANCFIEISGGSLKVNAAGDGLDSNGSLYVTGGETYVAGPENSGNGALDYAGEATISGGVFAAVGASGMAQNFGENSTQGAALMNFASTSGELVLRDGSGNELIRFDPGKTYSSAVVSCPEMKQGETFELTAGETSAEIEMTSVIVGSGSGMGMGGGGRPGGDMQFGGKGGMGGGNRPGGMREDFTPGEMPQGGLPEGEAPGGGTDVNL